MTSLDLSPSLSAAYTCLIEERFGMRLLESQVLKLNKCVLELLPATPFMDPQSLYTAFAAGSLPAELTRLAGRLSIGETHFFRVMPQIEALRRTILPDLIARHTADRRLRIWSAGCSTGEEAYTLAILISEQLSSPSDWDVELVGSDLDQDALEVAQRGLYADWSFRDTPSDLRRRYFTASANRWQLIEPVRRMVRFVQHNLTHDSVPCLSSGENIDLIMCRFVTIYFRHQVSQSLYQRFAAALQPSGWLILGPSDPAPAPGSGFEIVRLDGALGWRCLQPVAPASASQLVPNPAPRDMVVPHRTLGPQPTMTASRQPARARRTSISTDAKDHLNAGLLQLDHGAAESAIDSLRRAAFLDADSAIIQFALGRAYGQNGDRSRSRSAFSRAQRLLADSNGDPRLIGSEASDGQLRFAVDAQLAYLDKTK